MYYSHYINNLKDLEKSLFWLLYNNDVVSQFSSLSEREKEIIKRHYYDGIEFEEVGNSISLDAKETRELYHSALLKIVEEVRAYIAERQTLLNDLNENYNLKATVKQLKELISETDFKKLNYVNLDMHITAIDKLSARTLNVLKAHDIHTLGDLVSYTRNDLLKFRNMGNKSLKELDAVLTFYHIKLKK